jgi:hypothetical protein
MMSGGSGIASSNGAVDMLLRFQAAWKKEGRKKNFAVELVKRHEASDDIYKTFRDDMVTAIMPWTISERKSKLMSTKWTKAVRPEMEAACVMFILNYSTKWMTGKGKNLYVDGNSEGGKGESTWNGDGLEEGRSSDT